VEQEAAVGAPADGPAPLMEQAMVAAARQEDIVQSRGRDPRRREPPAQIRTCATNA
jgi:hypothetical protein